MLVLLSRKFVDAILDVFTNSKQMRFIKQFKRMSWDMWLIILRYVFCL